MVCRILTIVSILGLLISCSKGSHSGEPFLVDLKKKGELKIELDSLTSFNGKFIKYLHNKGDGHLFYMDYRGPRYCLFDINGDLLVTVDGYVIGDNAISTPSGVVPMGKDSLLIVGRFGTRLYKTDYSFKSSQSIQVNLNMYSRNSPSVLANIYSGSIPIIKDNYLYLSFIPLIKSLKSITEIFNKPILGKINLSTGDVYFIDDLRLPSSYKSKPINSSTTIVSVCDDSRFLYVGYFFRSKD